MSRWKWNLEDLETNISCKTKTVDLFSMPSIFHCAAAEDIGTALLFREQCQ